MKPWLCAVVAMIVIPGVVQAQGTLRIGDPKIESNQVIIPVLLSGNLGTGVAAMDFRVNYDPNVLRPVSADVGSAASDAGKRVMANEPAAGEYVVVMMGMNQATFSSGEVARIVMERTPGAEPNQWKLALSNPTLSGTDGSTIASSVAPYTPPSTDTDTKPTDTTPEKPDTNSPTDGTAKPGSIPTAPNMERKTEIAAVQTRAARQGGRNAKNTADEGERALKELRAAAEMRDEARGEIDTPSAEHRKSAERPEETGPGNIDTTDATSANADKANGKNAKPRLAAIQTIESTRSNPEGRRTASDTVTGNGSVGAAWKAIAAGIAAGVAVAVLSLVFLRRKVFG